MNKYQFIGFILIVLFIVGLRISMSNISADKLKTSPKVNDTDINQGTNFDISFNEIFQSQPEQASLEITESETEVDLLAPESFDFDPAKIEALRQAKQGEPRTPPISRGAARELPTPEELNDPELYLQFEQHQENKFKAGFVRASEGKINQIRQVIEHGKKHGMSEADIKMAEDKIRGIEAMRQRLLSENPNLLEVQTPELDLLQATPPEELFQEINSTQAE